MPVTPKKVKPAKTKTVRTNWLKNATKSIGSASARQISEYAPNISSIVQSSGNMASKALGSIKPMSDRDAMNKLNNNKYVKAVTKAFHNSVADLKAGYIMGGSDRTDSDMEAMFDSMQSSGVSFGDEGGATINYVSNGMSDDALASFGDVITNSAEQGIRMTKAQTDAQIAMSSASMAQMSQIANVMIEHLSGIENNLAALVEYNNTNMNQFIEGATAYFDKMGESIEDEETKKSGPRTSELFTGGRFNGRAYKEYVKNRFKEEFSDVAMLKDMMSGDMLEMLASDPLGTASGFMVEAMMPKIISTTAKGMEQTLNAAIPALMTKVVEFGESQGNWIGSDLVKRLTRSLGFGDEGNTEFDSRDIKIKRGAIPWDGDSKTALTYTIPTMLSEQTGYLKNISDFIDYTKSKDKSYTGNGAYDPNSRRVFNYNKNTFESTQSVYRDMMDDIISSRNSAAENSDLIKGLRRTFGGDERMDQALNILLSQLNSTKGERTGSGRSMNDFVKYAMGFSTNGPNRENDFYREFAKQIGVNYTESGEIANQTNEAQAELLRVADELMKTVGNVLNYSPTARMSATAIPYMGSSAAQGEYQKMLRNSSSGILDTQEYFKNGTIEEQMLKESTRRFNEANKKNAGAEFNFDVESAMNSGRGVGKEARELLSAIGNRSREGLSDVGKSIMSGDTQGVFEAVGAIFANAGSVALEAMDEHLFKPISAKLFGSGNEDGFSEGGILSAAENAVIDMTHSVAYSITGKSYKKSDGTVVPEDKTAVAQQVKRGMSQALFGKDVVDENGNRQQTQGLLSVVTDSVKEGLVHWHTAFFGKYDKNGNKVDKDNVTSLISDTVTENLPQAAKGAAGGAAVGLAAGGLLGSLIGGPIGGAAMGAAFSLLNKNEKFQKWLFGDGENDNGFISQKTQDFVKENKNWLAAGGVGGAAIGTVTGAGFLGTLVGGPVGGAILGLAGTTIAKSEMFQKFLFGDEERGRQGIVNAFKGIFNNTKKDLQGVDGKAVATLGIGALGGGLTAAVIGQMGVLGAMLTPMGPVGGALIGLGLGIKSQSATFERWLFGNKKDENDPEFQAGIVGQFKNMLMTNVLYPMRSGFQNMVDYVGTEIQYNVLDVVEEMAQPAVDLVKGIANKIGNVGMGIFDKVFGFVGENVASPIVKAVNVAVVQPIMKVGGTIGKLAVKAAVNTVTAPFKLVRRTTQFLLSPFAKAISKSLNTIFGKVGDFKDWLGDKIKDGAQAAFSFLGKTKAVQAVVGIARKGIGAVNEKRIAFSERRMNARREKAERKQKAYDDEWGRDAKEARENRMQKAYRTLVKDGKMNAGPDGNPISYEEWRYNLCYEDYEEARDNGETVESFDEYAKHWGGSNLTLEEMLSESRSNYRRNKARNAVSKAERRARDKNHKLILKYTDNNQFLDTEQNRALAEARAGKKLNWGGIDAEVAYKDGSIGTTKAKLAADGSNLSDAALEKADGKLLSPEARQSSILLRIWHTLSGEAPAGDETPQTAQEGAGPTRAAAPSRQFGRLEKYRRETAFNKLQKTASDSDRDLSKYSMIVDWLVNNGYINDASEVAAYSQGTLIDFARQVGGDDFIDFINEGGDKSVLSKFGIKGFAKGGTNPKTGIIKVGERGPEYIYSHAGDFIDPNRPTGMAVRVTGIAEHVARQFGLESGNGDIVAALADLGEITSEKLEEVAFNTEEVADNTQEISDKTGLDTTGDSRGDTAITSSKPKEGSYQQQQEEASKGGILAGIKGMFGKVMDTKPAKEVKGATTSLIDTGKKLLWAGLGVAFLSMGGAQAVGNIISAAITGIGNIANFFVNHGDDVVNGLKGIVSIAGKLLGGGIETVSDYAEELNYSMSNNVATNEEDTQEANTAQIANTAGAVVQGTTDIAGAAISGVNAFKTATKGGASLVKATKTATETATSKTGMLSGIGTSIGEGGGDLVTKVLSAAQEGVSTVIKNAGKVFGVDAADNVIAKAWDKIFGGALDAIKGLEKSLYNKLYSLLSTTIVKDNATAAATIASGGTVFVARVAFKQIANIGNTAKLFYVNREDVDGYMTAIAKAMVLFQSIPIVGSGLEIIDTIMTMAGMTGIMTLIAYAAYNIIVGLFDDEATEKLDKARSNFKTSYEEYNTGQSYEEYDSLKAAGLLPTDESGNEVSREDYYNGVQNGTYNGTSTSFVDYNTNTNKTLGDSVVTGLMGAVTGIGKSAKNLTTGIVAGFGQYAYKYYDDTKTGNVYIKNGKRYYAYNPETGELISSEGFTLEQIAGDLNDDTLKKTKNLKDIFGEATENVDLKQDDTLAESAAKLVTNVGETVNKQLNQGAHIADNNVVYYNDTISGNVYLQNDNGTWDSYDNQGNQLDSGLSTSEIQSDITGSVKALTIDDTGKNGISTLNANRTMFSRYDSQSTGSTEDDWNIGKTLEEVEADVVGLEDGMCWLDPTGCYYTMEKDGTYIYRSQYGYALKKNISAESMTSLVISNRLIQAKINNVEDTIGKIGNYYEELQEAGLDGYYTADNDDTKTYYKNGDGTYTSVDAAGRVKNVTEEEATGSGQTIESAEGTRYVYSLYDGQTVIVPNGTSQYALVQNGQKISTVSMEDIQSILTAWGEDAYSRAVANVEDGFISSGANSYVLDSNGTSYTKYNKNGSIIDSGISEEDIAKDGSTVYDEDQAMVANKSSKYYVQNPARNNMQGAYWAWDSAKSKWCKYSPEGSPTGDAVNEKAFAKKLSSGVVALGNPFGETNNDTTSSKGGGNGGGRGVGLKASRKHAGGGGFGNATLGTQNGFAYASQNDSRWGDDSYSNGDGATMADSGCGPTAMSMVVTGLTGKNVSPTEMADFAIENGNRDDTGTNWDYIDSAANRYGLNTAQTMNPSADSIVNALDDGHPVVLSGTSSGAGTPYTSAGHYSVAVGMDSNGKVLVNDPRGASYSTSYSPEELAKYTESSWEVGGGNGGFGLKKNWLRGGKGNDHDSTYYELDKSGKYTGVYYEYYRGNWTAYRNGKKAGSLTDKELAERKKEGLVTVTSENVRSMNQGEVGNGGKGSSSKDMANNFPFYLQGDSRWGTIRYSSTGNSSQTIASSGCGPTSMAMILKSYGNSVTPKDTASYAVKNGYRTANNGTAWGFFKSIGNKYGLDTSQLSPSTSNLTSKIGQNIPIVASMHAGHFTKGGHFITVVGGNGSKVYVNDPASKSRTNQSWSASTVANEANAFWAITKNGQGSINNVVASSDGDGSSSTEGATEETSSSVATEDASATITDKYGNYLSGVSSLLMQAVASGDFTALDYQKLVDLWNGNGTASTSSTDSTTTATGTVNEAIVDAKSLGSTNKERIFNYLVKYGGFTKAGAAGAMGNMKAESGLRTNNMEDWFESRLTPRYNDKTYTKAVDNGTYKTAVQHAYYYGKSNYKYGGTFSTDKVGYGLIQWTSDNRKKNLLNYVKKAGTSVADISGQLGFLLHEIKNSKTYKKVLNTVQKTNSVYEAAKQWYRIVESGGGSSASAEKSRGDKGQAIYNELVGGSGKGKQDGGGYGPSGTKIKNATGADAREALVGWMLCIIGRNTYTQKSSRTRVLDGVTGHGYGDCSSTVWKIYQKAVGKSIGTWTGNQYNKGTRVLGPNTSKSKTPDESYMLPGDLVFFYSKSARPNNLYSSIGHVEMYIGNGYLAGHGSGTGPKIHKMSTYQRGRISSGYGTWAIVVRHITDDKTYTVCKPNPSYYKKKNKYTDGNGRSKNNKNSNADASSSVTSTDSSSATLSTTAESAPDDTMSKYGSFLSGVGDEFMQAAISGDFSNITADKLLSYWNGTSSTAASTADDGTTSDDESSDSSTSSSSTSQSTAASVGSAIVQSATAYNNTLLNAINKGEKWIYSKSGSYVKQKSSFEDMVRAADDGSLQRGANEHSIANWALRDTGMVSGKSWLSGDKTHISYYTGTTKDNIDKYMEKSAVDGSTVKKLYNAGKLKKGDILFGNGKTYVYYGSGQIFDSGHGVGNYTRDSSIKSDDAKNAVFKKWLMPLSSDTIAANTKIYNMLSPKSDVTTKTYRTGSVSLGSGTTVVKPGSSATASSKTTSTMSAAGEGIEAKGDGETKEAKEAAKIIARLGIPQGDAMPAKARVSRSPRMHRGGRGATTSGLTSIGTGNIFAAGATTSVLSVDEVITTANKAAAGGQSSQLLLAIIQMLEIIANNTGSEVDYLAQATSLIGKLNGNSGNAVVTQVVNQPTTPVEQLSTNTSSGESRNETLAKRIAAGR